MRIISDITGKEYKTVDECLKAEKEYKEAKAKAEKEKAELQAKKDAAYQKAIDACDEYLKLCGIETHFDDNGYRVKIHSDDKADKIFEDILNAWLS